jgi:hypothetical protein
LARYLPYDWDALAAAPDATAWLELLIDQAITREAITFPEIEALQAVAQSATAAELDTLRAAFSGTAFDIPAAMNDAWDTLESLLRRVPSPQTVAFAQKMRMEGGYVGQDDDGRTVWTTTGGGIFVVDPDERVPDGIGRH